MYQSFFHQEKYSSSFKNALDSSDFCIIRDIKNLGTFVSRKNIRSVIDDDGGGVGDGGDEELKMNNSKP